MVAYRLRIELPDRPAPSAQVTAAIADSEANIVSIDVHEVDGDTAIDEIVVQVSDEWVPGPLATSLAGKGFGTMLSSRRATSLEDPVTAAISAVAAMMAGDPEVMDAECCKALLGLAHGASARLFDVDGAALDPAGSMALERGTTLVARSEDGGSAWVLAALDDTLDPHTVAIVTRPLNVRFSSTEVSRVEALLQIRRRLLIGRAVGSP